MNALLADAVKSAQAVYDNLKDAFDVALNENDSNASMVQDAMNKATEIMSHVNRLASLYPMPDASTNDGANVKGRTNATRGN